jgi:uncharacterized zinc-type alcohol dehydrogenase-like protein
VPHLPELPARASSSSAQQGGTFTYNSPDAHSGGMTYGGYSQRIVSTSVRAARADEPRPAAAAPLLCAGITTYSPLEALEGRQGQKVGVVGLGGLGHMGVKFARAFGAHTVRLHDLAGKAADALRLGAARGGDLERRRAMAKHAGSFDFILDTVSAEHDLNAYLGC